MPNNKNPLAEVFGYVISNIDQKVIKLRKKKICPFKNKFKKCTKDKLDNPLGVCSIYSHNKYILELVQKKYSKFDNIIKDIITPQAGEQSKFINVLQNKLNNSK